MKKQKGSFIVTLLIIAIFVFSAVFYIKTSHPALYREAITFVKDKISENKGISEVNSTVYDKIFKKDADTENYVKV